MTSIVSLPPGAQDEPRENHPDLPIQGEDEDFLEHLNRVADWLSESPPPAPAGFVLVECAATPRHFPEYRVAEDVFYPGECMQCHAEATWRDVSKLKCERDHRRWKSWRIWRRIASFLYVTGITPNGGSSSYGRCEFCGIGVQHRLPYRFRGSRPYVLWVRREIWSCLLKRHHRYRLHYPSGLCAICCPCPECGSTDQGHYTCEVA